MVAATAVVDKAREQEEAAVAMLLRHLRSARQDRLNGELRVCLTLRDGGVMGRKVVRETVEK